MDDSLWIGAVRAAGACHLITLVLACFTPIPENWDANLAALPEVHRRFSVAQNFAIGATIAFCGLVSLVFAPVLVKADLAARILCAGIALWWGGRLVILPWLRVGALLKTPLLRVGFVLLHLECAAFAAGYGWLALRN